MKLGLSSNIRKFSLDVTTPVDPNSWNCRDRAVLLALSENQAFKRSYACHRVHSSMYPLWKGVISL